MLDTMKILVTGSSGFLGSWLCRVLAEDHEVIALIRETSDLSKLSDLHKIKIKILTPELWANYVFKLNPDVLILNHWSGVDNESRNDPGQIKNVLAIRTLADAAVIAGVKRIIGVGSQAELGPVASTISEAQIDNPTTFYGRSKVQTRLAIEDLVKGTEVNFTWMRIFSTYGPLDNGNW